MQYWTTFFDSLILSPRPSSDGPMARMMRTEYRKDYDDAVRNRGFMSEEHAKNFLNTMKF